MRVQILNEIGEVIWERGTNSGIACRDYVANGMQTEIISTLKSAVEQAESEFLVFDVVDRIPDIGRVAR